MPRYLSVNKIQNTYIERNRHVLPVDGGANLSLTVTASGVRRTPMQLHAWWHVPGDKRASD